MIERLKAFFKKNAATAGAVIGGALAALIFLAVFGESEAAEDKRLSANRGCVSLDIVKSIYSQNTREAATDLFNQSRVIARMCHASRLHIPIVVTDLLGSEYSPFLKKRVTFIEFYLAADESKSPLYWVVGEDIARKLRETFQGV